jgi:hypothetical protein
VRGQQYEVETVVDLIDTIFNSDARHRLSLRVWVRKYVAMRARYSDRGLSASINFEKARKTPVMDDRHGSMAEGSISPMDKNSLHCFIRNVPRCDATHRGQYF